VLQKRRSRHTSSSEDHLVPNVYAGVAAPATVRHSSAGRRSWRAADRPAQVERDAFRRARLPSQGRALRTRLLCDVEYTVALNTLASDDRPDLPRSPKCVRKWERCRARADELFMQFTAVLHHVQRSSHPSNSRQIGGLGNATVSFLLALGQQGVRQTCRSANQSPLAGEECSRAAQSSASPF
jgi:hypothetical protein